jgi:hypothetical protein
MVSRFGIDRADLFAQMKIEEKTALGEIDAA